MKKIYFLAIALIAFTANAQYSINFDDMNLGPVCGQSPYIELWPGQTCADVVNTHSNSPANSMFISGNGSDDVVFLAGNKTSGVWSVKFNLYVPGGNTGYWNIQEDEIPAVQWNGEFLVGVTQVGGTAGMITYRDTGATVPYLSDFWVDVVFVFDLDNLRISSEVMGETFLDNEPYLGTTLGSITYFSIDPGLTAMYIDDYEFIEGNALSTSDFQTSSFTVFPNPVQDRLSIQSNEVVSNVTVYNVLGQVVNVSAPNTVSPSIDMSTFKSGIYFVEVTIGDSTKTVKVVK